MQAPDDPIFATWAQFVADTIRQTYPPGQMHPSRMGRYPTADDIAGAYGAFRLLLSLATEDDVEPPTPPMTTDPGAVLDKMWTDIASDLSMIPPPPSGGRRRELQPGRAVERDQGRARPGSGRSPTRH